MDNQKPSFSAALKAARLSLGITQKELATLTGITPALISRYEQGKGNPRAETVERLAEALEIQVEQLLEAQANNDFIKFPVLSDVQEEPKISGGMEIDSWKNLTLPRDSIKFNGNPSNLVATEVIGNSMEPLLNRGDLVLFDKSQTDIADGGIYCFMFHDIVRIKKLSLSLHGDWVISSINSAEYPDEILSKQDLKNMYIFGRVVWRSGFID